jgi:hypothetical protein
MNSDGTRSRLVNEGFSHRFYGVSPDGKKILWLEGGICVSNLDGSNKKVIKKHSTTKIDYRY